MNQEEAHNAFRMNSLQPKCPAAVDGAPGDHAQARVSPFAQMPDGNLWRAYICNCGERFIATVTP